MEKKIDKLLNLEKYKWAKISSDTLKELLWTCLTISHEYAHIPNIEWCTIWGSLGRAFVDEKSDIEMYMYYNWKIPTKETIENLIANDLKCQLTRSNDVHRYNKAWGHHSFFSMNGVNIELWYRNTQDVEKKIKTFNDSLLLPQHWLHDTPFGHYHSWLLACLKESTIILDKNDKLEELQRWISHFPENIKEATIKYYFNDAFFLLQDKLITASKRKDILLFNACVSRIIRSLTILIFTLNDTYYPWDKRNQKYLKQFNILPVWFIEKITEIYKSFDDSDKQYKESVECLVGIIDECEQLIKNHTTKQPLLKIPDLEPEREINPSTEEIVEIFTWHNKDVTIDPIKEWIGTMNFMVNIEGNKYVLREAWEFVTTVEPQIYIQNVLRNSQEFDYDIPTPVTTKNDKNMIKIGNKFYYMYPYIVWSHKDGTDNSYAQQLGSLIAKYHRTINLQKKENDFAYYISLLRKKTIGNGATYEKLIHTSEWKNKEYINKRDEFLQKTWHRLQQIEPIEDNEWDTFCFSDYNNGNILMNDWNITGIIDFWWLHKMPRILDLQNGLQQVYLQLVNKDNFQEKDTLISSYYEGIRKIGRGKNISWKQITFYMLHDIFLTLCRLLKWEKTLGNKKIPEWDITNRKILIEAILDWNIIIPDYIESI